MTAQPMRVSASQCVNALSQTSPSPVCNSPKKTNNEGNNP